MQGEYVLFSKSLGGRDDRNNTQITLSCDQQSLLAKVDPIGISVNEGFNRVTPVVEFMFKDGTGSLLNKGKINYENTFYLNYGSSMENSVNSMPLRVSNIENVSGTKGKVENIVYKIVFFMKNWTDTMSVSRNRSWTDTYYSQVARQIASECGYKKTDIEQTKQVNSVIQQNIPNSKFIRHIHRKASSPTHDDVFEYGCTIQGKFILKSLSGIILENQSRIDNRNIPFIVMNNPPPGTKARRIDNNYNYSPEFMSFRMIEKYSDNTIEGGSGFDVSYFDFDTGEYVRQQIKNSELRNHQTADLQTLSSSDESGTYKVFGGRSPEIVDDTKVRLSRIANSYNKYNLELDFSLGATIGDVIEIMLPLIQPTSDDDLASIPYGGYYVVSDVLHVFNLQKRTKQTTLTVVRQGFNRK